MIIIIQRLSRITIKHEATEGKGEKSTLAYSQVVRLGWPT